MCTLSVIVFCTFVVLGSSRGKPYNPKCCENIGRFRDCRRACKKAWNERNSGKKLELALSLPKSCPSHLISLWQCLNSSIKGFELYTHPNLLKGDGRSCCLLAIGASCRQSCFTSTNLDNIRKTCEEDYEESLLRCVERNHASKKCCVATKKSCERACKRVFASHKHPSRHKLMKLQKSCGWKHNHVYNCVSNLTLTTEVTDHKCCQTLQNNLYCQKVCREIMASQSSIKERISMFGKVCKLPFHNPIWKCFLIHTSSPNTNKPSQEERKVDVRLHCCLNAKTEECFNLCIKAFTDEPIDNNNQFRRKCAYEPKENSMMTCIADVSQPCHIGCHGLGFCTNFNYRHTELFRSCRIEKDNAAKSDYENWVKKQSVEIHSMDIIPVKNISKCLPFWKVIACTLHIQPCHAKSHTSSICRHDCLKVLNECAAKEKLGVRTVEMICKKLSPDNQSSCIPLEDFMKPSLYQNQADEVTRPCYPNPCRNNVCEVNRRSTEMQSLSSHKCSPGCPIDHQSKAIIKNGDFARLPLIHQSKSQGCFKICRCEKGKFSACPRLPSCVSKKSCYLKLTNNTYLHQEKFSVNCNFCVCFDGEIICSQSQCSSADVTNRLRRNHLPYYNNTLNDLPCHQCDDVYNAVCGTNGKTYRNPCFARCSRLKKYQLKSGQCSTRNSCNISPCKDDEICVISRKVCVDILSSCPQFLCIKRSTNNTSSMQPYCDTENNQYLNKHAVLQAGKEIAYQGDCNSSCAPGVLKVCGVDGQTYSSVCALKYAKMLLDYEGPCRTVGKFNNERSVRCADIKCPMLNPSNCEGITPPGACCEVCATQMTILFDEDEIAKTNRLVRDKSQPITQDDVVARVRRHISMSECDVFGFYNTYRNFVLLITTITDKPTTLQFLVCMKEAEKIETLINTESPIFTSDEILSSFRAVKLQTPLLSENKLGGGGKSSTQTSSMMLLLVATTLSLLIFSRR
ncbi:reversion-inducing cysteine-rich protein with Kazal motifs-like [Xenia sp. Carnegie-2017]|uniref:reversion-inducing cysteine-rich protein with Kazal motifs-like n=1 Tax=Xenia sp. Carnegie-2017 TaxID=2897299 RepID=UPI001F040FBE|nr:reversion-inducing cysteine-rich protein with Kazal motifs-like [Xenia sp. Carnegie-2017]